MGLRSGAALLLVGLSVSTMAAEHSGLDRSIKGLDDQIVALNGQGRTEEALPLARQVLALRLKDGPEDSQYASSLANLGLLYAEGLDHLAKMYQREHRDDLANPLLYRIKLIQQAKSS